MRVLFASLVLSLGVASAAFASEAVVDVVLNPMGDFKAKTADVKGEAIQKGDEVFAQNIVVNLKSLKTGVELRDKHTQKHLETEKYPEAVLISASGKGGKGKGKLKIRGIEKDVEGTYKVDGQNLIADFKVNIAEYGIKDINYMGVGVEDEVALHVVVPVKSAK
ncbi:MAG TPA: YceI family protein [Bdellovibrio sp.]|uniref:YceI family protein n=1 Tax=Bdellovibrio sp. TaxID=28201 RepID=UPI002F0C8A0F